MPLPDLLQWLSLSRKIGILILERGDVVKELYLTEGRIVSSSSNDPREFFGQFLLAFDLVDEETLTRVFALQGETGIRLGRLLVMEGYLSEEEVQRFLRIKAEETIYELFLWGDQGSFKFFDDEPSQGTHVPIQLDVTSILMEGSRRADEWGRIRSFFPSNQTVVQVVPDRISQEVLTDPLYSRMVQLIETPRRIADLCLQFHASDFSINKALYDLHRMGVLEVIEAPQSEEKPPTQDVEVRQLLMSGLRSYNNREYEEAIRRFKEVLTIDPDNVVAIKQLEKSHGEVQRELLSEDFSIEAIPVLRRSLEELEHLSFTPQESYILSRINGSYTVQAILRISPIQELQALVIFKRFLADGIIVLEDPSPSSK